MIWILVIWFVGSTTAVTTHEFIGKEACDNAGKMLSQKGGLGYKIEYGCVPKGVYHAK